MKFSVIIPVLNGAQYIEASILSVLQQSYEDWEMLVIDGTSTDGTIDIADNYQQLDARITLVSEPDDGLYDALIKGIKSATGDWVCWLNSDDLYTPWCFSTIREYLNQETGSQWITGFPSCWDANGCLRYIRPVGCYSQRKIAAGWHHEKLLGYLQQESIFFSRNLIDALSDQEISQLRGMRYAGDFLLWRLLAKHAPLQVVPSALGGFRRHAANMSVSENKSYWAEVESTKPFHLPAPVAGPFAYAFRLYAAVMTWRLIQRTDGVIERSLPPLKDSP